MLVAWAGNGKDEPSRPGYGQQTWLGTPGVIGLKQNLAIKRLLFALGLGLARGTGLTTRSSTYYPCCLRLGTVRQLPKATAGVRILRKENLRLLGNALGNLRVLKSLATPVSLEWAKTTTIGTRRNRKTWGFDVGS